MAFNAQPDVHIASWSEDGTNITVPIASIAELTAAEADGTNGDIRKIIFALSEKFYQVYNTMATADRPAKMRLYRSSQTNEATGVVTRSYTFQFDLDVGSIEVASE